MLVAHPTENFDASKGAKIPAEASFIPDTPASPISPERKEDLRARLREKLRDLKWQTGRDRGMNM